jgi:microcystin-dependent protein/phage-related tail fiber protein
MSTTTPKLSLPRAESADYFNLSNYDALIDAIDTNAVGKAEKGVASGIPTLDVNALIPLSQIPATLTGKDADTVDGKHATDLVQFVNGAVPVGTPINLTNILNIFSNRIKGFGTNNNSLMIAANGGTVSIRPVSDSSTTGEMIISSTGATLGGNTVWTSGNQGPTSGMNADLLDGQHGSYYATATHNHDGTYVRITGDTLTGSLKSTTANPFISKLSTYKSAAFTHLSGNQLALQFSTTADQEDWNTSSQFVFDANGNFTVPAQIAATSGSISGNMAAVSFTEGGTALSSKYALSARKVTAGSGLTGGGDLTADRTVSVSFAGTGSASTVSRSDHTHTLSAVTDVTVTTPATNDLLIYSTATGKWANSSLSNAGIAPLSHVGSGGSAHAVVTTSVNGFMAATDKSKLDGIENNANNYTHPSGDGYSHVPATGTTNNTKVLKAGSTANSAAWGQVLFSEIGSKPTTLSGYGITDATPSSHIGSGGSAHAQATQSVDGFMSASDKQKLDGIAANASAPQNTFTYIAVGASNIIASTTGDTLTFAAGSNITLTPDTTNKKVTIGVTSPNGFASVVAGGTTLSASSPTSSLTLANGTGISITGSGTTATIGVSMDDTLHGSRGGGSLHSAVTTSTNGFMISTDKAKLDTFVITSPASGNILRHNGTNWVNTTLSASDIPSLDWSKISSGKPTTLSGYGITDAVNSSSATTTATANKLLYLDANAKLPANITGNADGNAATATKLATARAIGHSGDVTGSASFDGTADVTIAMTLANSGVTAGTYKSVTVDSKGRVTAGTNPTTLSGYGITDAVASSTIVTTATANKVLQLDANSKLPASITGNADGNAATASKWATARTISLAGDASGSVSLDGSANATLTLTNNYKSLSSLTDTTITSPGTGNFLRYNGTSWLNTALVAGDIPSLDWSKITTGKPTTLSGYGITDGINTSAAVTTATANKLLYLDASGNLPASVTGNAATATKLQTGRTITLTGDTTASAVTFDGSANISIATTLANSGVTAGTYRSVTVNAKGLVTGGTNPTTISGYGITDAYTKSEINTVRNETIDNFVSTGLTTTASTTTNLMVTVAAGTVYVGGVRYTPVSTNLTLTASTTQYIYVNTSGVITASSTAPTGDYADLATVIVPASGLIPAGNVTDTRDIVTNTRGKMSYDLYNDSGTYAFYVNSRGAGNGVQIKNSGTSNAFVVTDGDTSKDNFLIDGSGNVKLENAADFYIYSDAGTTQKFLVDGATGDTNISGKLTVTGTITGSLTGNASTASKWATARTITLGGDVSGSVSLDGSANVTLTVTDTYKSITSLTDTTITSAASGNFLRYNGTAWVNTALVAADIPSLDWSKITTGKPTTVSGYGITDAVTTARTVSTSTGLTGGGALSGNLTLSFDTTWGDARYANVTGQTFTGNITAPVLISSVATGTAPFTVTSTTKVTNLNADMVDGYSFNQSLQTTNSVTFAGLTVNGTASFYNSATMNAQGTATSSANYNSELMQFKSSYWNGTAAATYSRSVYLSSAGNIGFTNTAGSTNAYITDAGDYYGNTFHSTVATGTAPLTVASTTLVTNLNADLLDGQSGSYYTNQNAFSNIVVGSSTIAADTATDSLTLVATAPITITADTTNDKVTFDIANATASADGAMSAADKSKLDGIAAGADAIPAGAITMFAGGSLPSGWLWCQGQAVSRTTYSALYSAIGTTYGTGDGSTTFNLPNMGGRVPVGTDVNQTEFSSLGKTGGEKTHTLSTTEMPSHSHNIKFGGASMSMGSGSTGDYLLTGWTTGGGVTQVTEDAAGGGGAHNNLQPYISFNFMIKY